MRNILVICLFALLLSSMSMILLLPPPAVSARHARPPAEEPAESTLAAEAENSVNDVVETEKPSEPGVKRITALNGTVILEMEKFTTPFYGISMRFTDKSINMGSGSYLEIRKAGSCYYVDGKNEIHCNLEDGLKSYLKNYLERQFKSWELDSERNGAYWRAFVEEGKVPLFIDIINGFIDDEFLNAPFNDSWG